MNLPRRNKNNHRNNSLSCSESDKFVSMERGNRRHEPFPGQKKMKAAARAPRTDKHSVTLAVKNTGRLVDGALKQEGSMPGTARLTPNYMYSSSIKYARHVTRTPFYAPHYCIVRHSFSSLRRRRKAKPHPPSVCCWRGGGVNGSTAGLVRNMRRK